MSIHSVVIQFDSEMKNRKKAVNATWKEIVEQGLRYFEDLNLMDEVSEQKEEVKEPEEVQEESTTDTSHNLIRYDGSYSIDIIREGRWTEALIAGDVDFFIEPIVGEYMRFRDALGIQTINGKKKFIFHSFDKETMKIEFSND